MFRLGPGAWSLDEERQEERSSLCWAQAGFRACKRKGKHWVQWNALKKAFLCTQHAVDMKRVGPPKEAP